MKIFVITAIVVIVMVGIMVPNIHAEEIPDWIKHTSGWWADGDVNDDDFMNGIGFLIKNGIITLPVIDTTDGISEKNILNLLQDKYPEISFSGIVVPRPIMPVYVTLIDPDGIITNSETYADGKGNYSVIFKFDRSSKTGIYHVNVHHWNKLVKEDSFKLEKTSVATTIPSWIKNNAGWWADGVIDDDSFVSGIEYLVNNRILILGDSETESSFETKIIIDTTLDFTYGDEFSLANSSDFPVAVIIEGDLQEKGRIQLSITGIFDMSGPMTYD